MLEQNKKYFQDRVKEYEVSYLRDDEEFLVKKYFNKKGAKLLVLGCGAGRTLKPLHKKGFKIIAVDIVPEMVRASQKHTKGLGIDVREGDATNLKFSNNFFDYVFFPFHGIDSIYSDNTPVIREAARTLNKEGVFIFNSHNRWFLKKLKYIFKGKYVDYAGVLSYRSSLFDFFRLKKYFKKVKIKYRISMQKKEHSNWKDKCYQLLPFVSISIYFICQNPKKNK